MKHKVQDDEEDGKLKLHDVWRTCNKIRAAIFRVGINLWDYFKPLDPKSNTLISESKFINVLANQLRGVIGLSRQEIEELADYFRVQDGRIFYHQFCDVIHSNNADNTKNPDLVSGLEWEDPLQVNRLSQSENRRLCVLLTKIAQTVRLRELVLRPYFQDYELISKNNGTVTLAHFSRVLHFLKIYISSEDYRLLVKRYMKDSYTVNYVAFVEDLEGIVRYFDTHRLINLSEDIIENFPGRLLDAELPKLPRPEIGTIRIADVFGKETSFHPVLKPKKPKKDVHSIILRIKKHIVEYRLRVCNFFQDFDLLRCGYITKSQFIRGIDQLLLAGLHRMYLSEIELDEICSVYADELDPSRMHWKQFEDDIDVVFTVKNLDKKPFEIVVVPPREVTDLHDEGHDDWQSQTNKMRNLCDEAVYKCKAQISKRKLFLEPVFKSFDRHSNSHVTRTQMRQVLLSNGVLLSDEELYALERRYNDDLGFNYIWFLNEADPKDYAIPKYEEFQEKMILLNKEKSKREPNYVELDIVQVLGKIKGQAVRKQVRIKEFVKDFDRHNEQCIPEVDFRRGLSNANIHISEPEVDLICDVFKSPLRLGYVDYFRFCNIVEEAFHQPCLERAPLIVPLQHFPSEDNPFNFLNFDERTTCSLALRKLSKKNDQVSNLSSLFEDYDRVKCGTISENQFLRALTTRDLHNLISSHEFEVVCKCFSVQRGVRCEVDYRRFLSVLDLIHGCARNYPF